MKNNSSPHYNLKSLALLFLAFFFTPTLFPQNLNKSYDTVAQYEIAFDILKKSISEDANFTSSVFIVENLFQNNTLDFSEYKSSINNLTTSIILFYGATVFSKHRNADSLNYKINSSIFYLFKNGIGRSKSSMFNSSYLSYNFTDPQGNQDWTNTFVTKLLATHKGNCRSLTYLYKILADELGAKCWLALAPNHIYIRNYSKQIGWYNTELTSGAFPTDAWIAATGYVNVDAIRSGVYMDTLSNQQSVGLCIMDLAQGYIKQTNNYTDSFVLKCCNLVLQYHSVNPEALLTKAEALKRMYLKQKEENNPKAQDTYNEMEQTYITLVKLGYREMPYQEYQKWLKTTNRDKEKYQNKKLNNAAKKN